MTGAHCTVECYSGHTHAQEPRTVVTAEGQRRPVAAVELRWRTPAGPAFRVRTEDGQRLDLIYSEADDLWQAVLLPDAPQAHHEPLDEEVHR